MPYYTQCCRALISYCKKWSKIISPPSYYSRQYSHHTVKEKTLRSSTWYWYLSFFEWCEEKIFTKYFKVSTIRWDNKPTCIEISQIWSAVDIYTEKFALNPIKVHPRNIITKLQTQDNQTFAEVVKRRIFPFIVRQ